MMKHAVQSETIAGGRDRPAGMGRFARKRWIVTASVAAGVVVGAAVSPAGAQPTGLAQSRAAAGNEFVQTNLVTDLPTGALMTKDHDLLNPWGVSMGPATPLWVSDNNAGASTLYNIPAGGKTVTKRTLRVTIPGGRASTSDTSSPTGQVFNPTTGFTLTKGGTDSALFIFDSESGQLSGWNPTTDPISGTGMSTGSLKFSSPTAVYKGLAIATDSDGTFLYASNFHSGQVDVFNDQWQKVSLAGDFRDPRLPAGYAPFGIQVLNDLVYVSYAKQNAAKHDDVAGSGHGFIDIYTLNGFLVERLASRGALNSPWGMTIAPPSFGRFAGMLLVGNFGDGHINVFDPFAPNRLLGQLRNAHQRPITIDGLWALRVGTSTTGGTNTVLFTAGLNSEKDGLLGSINPVS
jgi:uncharacterized protein (TIGR03118 family)